MRKWLRRIRGALGIGSAWALGWASVGALWGLYDFGALVPALVGGFAFFGFFSGTVFSTVLGLTEGRRRFDELSLPRFAAWGALGGFLMSGPTIVAGMWEPGVFTMFNAMIAGVTTFLGAGSAAGSLALARTVDDRELLDAGGDAGAVGLTEQERRELLGS